MKNDIKIHPTPPLSAYKKIIINSTRRLKRWHSYTLLPNANGHYLSRDTAHKFMQREIDLIRAAKNRILQIIAQNN